MRADILVVAPHPDDDILTSAGVTHATRNSGEAVWIVYMTNGDSPGLSTGAIRQNEGAAAEALLGVDSAHLVFLGYPDGSLSTLRGECRAPTSAYDSPNPNIDRTTTGSATYPPYGQISGTNGRNNAYNVRADLAHFINAHRPRNIYVTGRCDRHPDHSSSYEFVVEAVQNVRSGASSYDPTIYQTIVWAGFGADDDWPAPTNPTTDYTEPVRIQACMTDNGLAWSSRVSIPVPANMQSTDYGVNLKARAINQHQSQGGFHAMTVRSPSDGHLSAFVHRDEFFFAATAPAGNNAPLDAGSFPADPAHCLVDAGTPPPVDSGTPPPVDSGTPPPVDSGTPPPVDSGTPPPVDSGTPPLDSGTQPLDAGAQQDASIDAGDSGLDSGSAALDSGSAQLDAGTVDSGTADAGQARDAALVDGGTASASDGSSANAGDDTGSPASSGDTTTAWPGDEDWEQAVDDLIHQDGGAEKAADDGDGCTLSPAAPPARFSGLFAVLTALAAFVVRRGRRS